MRKIFYILLFLASCQTYSLAGCCCKPVVSCTPVSTTMEKAKVESLKDVSFNDDQIGENWLTKVEQEMKEIKKLKDISLETQKNITNLEFANLVESYNEEFLYLSLLDYKKASFDEDALKNKLLLLEANLNQSIEKSKSNLNEENIFIKQSK